MAEEVACPVCVWFLLLVAVGFACDRVPSPCMASMMAVLIGGCVSLALGWRERAGKMVSSRFRGSGRDDDKFM
jgi:hypothetical protein